MTADRGDEPGGDRDLEAWEDERPRSLLRTTWSRVLVIVLVIAAVAVLAIPYVIDMTSAPRQAARELSTAPKPAPSPSAPEPSTAPAPTAAATAASSATTPPPTMPSPAIDRATERPKPSAATPEPARIAAPKPDPTRSAARAAKRDSMKRDLQRAAAREPVAATRESGAAVAAGGERWVQVGAFRDRTAAQRLAATLKEKGFAVAESATTPPGPIAQAPAAGSSAVDRYDVVVTGGAAPDLVQKLNAKGLSAERSGDGATVRPSLTLRDAVSLSNDLRAEGFKVSVRRVPRAPAAAPLPATGETLYRVRVGAFPDRTAALDAVEKLQRLGYKPFVAQGP